MLGTLPFVENLTFREPAVLRYLNFCHPGRVTKQLASVCLCPWHILWICLRCLCSNSSVAFSSDKILNNLGQEHLNHSDILLLILVNE